jgi:hypothetical protein
MKCPLKYFVEIFVKYMLKISGNEPFALKTSRNEPS